MKIPPKIVVLDRSELAANLYRVLFGEITTSILILSGLSSAKNRLHGRDRIDMTVVNSNVLNKKDMRSATELFRNKCFRMSKKILLHGQSPSEIEMAKELADVHEFKTIERPFAPEKLLAHAKRIASK